MPLPNVSLEVSRQQAGADDGLINVGDDQGPLLGGAGDLGRVTATVRQQGRDVWNVLE